MKWNLPLTWIALTYVIVNLLFAYDASTSTGGTSLIYVIIFPLFWGVTLIVVAILCFTKRDKWFRKDTIISTLFLLFFCTPIPFLILNEMNQPEMTRSSTGYNPDNGITIKSETWVYSPGQVAIRKYWKLNSEDWMDFEESEFKKDSTWIYLDKRGDTIKTETYEDDRLIDTKEYNS